MKAKIILVMLFFGTAIPTFADTLIDAVNQDSLEDENAWLAADVGWQYAPSFGYSLTEIQTKFGVSYHDIRTVTVEIYDGLPANGGRLLRSAEFTPTNGVFCGARFLPLNLIARHTYFIGFRNVSSLGVNTTANPVAEAMPPLYFSYYDDGSYLNIDTGQGATSTAKPILEFYGNSSLTPAQEVDQLISVVEATDISRAKKRLLENILFQARNASNHNNTILAANILRVFQNQVRLQIARADELAAEFINELAKELIDEIRAQQVHRVHFEFQH